MDNLADFSEEIAEDGNLIIKFSGQFTICHIGDIDNRLRDLGSAPDTLDLSEINKMDTVGAWILERTINQSGANVIGADHSADRLIAELRRGADQTLEKGPYVNSVVRFFSDIGKSAVQVFTSMLDFMAFVGQVVVAAIKVLLRPSRLRFSAIVQHFEMVGARALPIVGLMSFLIGIVVAQQGAVQLQQFGAEVFTVNLVGRLTFRELGVLMTAIMIAGRSGSSFAAQIGTMKITEEIDAMRTIGVSPIEALVLPRFFATIIMMPLVGFYACIMSILGAGLLTWFVLDIPPVSFIDRIREVTPMKDIYVGMIKAPLFGAIIAMAGCFQGMQVRNNAEEVGAKTTAAVVQAIFLVIVLDAFFAIFFSEIGW